MVQGGGAEGRRSPVKAKLKTSCSRFARKGGAGPEGGRYEHWVPLTTDPETADAVAGTLARMGAGATTEAALRAYLSARLASIAKANSGVRVLGCGGVIRRMVAKAVAKVSRCSSPTSHPALESSRVRLSSRTRRVSRQYACRE